MKNQILKTIFIIALFLNIKVISQILVNNDPYFQIYLDKEFMINDSPASCHKNSFILINKTNKNYLINISGFNGSSLIYRNGDRLLPYLPGLSGYPADWNDEECKKNILLISKKEKRKSILYLDIIHGYYNVNNQDEYEIDFETEHTKESPYYYGCEKYVDSLKNKGYKIYEGILKGKVKLIQEK